MKNWPLRVSHPPIPRYVPPPPRQILLRQNSSHVISKILNYYALFFQVQVQVYLFSSHNIQYI